MYICDVHYCKVCIIEKSKDFSYSRANGPFVLEIFAPLRGKINVNVMLVWVMSVKDVTSDFIIREVPFIECFFPLN